MTRILHTKVETGKPLLASDITNLTFFPVGTILMMDGSWQDGRGGWYICDGTDNTPDLRNLFIRGGASSGSKGGNDQPSVTLTSANIPQHNHSFSGETTVTGVNDTGHTHSVTAAGIITGLGTHNHTITNNEGTHSHTITANEGTHNHTIAANGGTHGHTINDPQHSHSISTSGRHGQDNDAAHPSAAWDYGDVYWATTSTKTSTSESTGITVVANQGSHTHTITSNEGGHTHTITSSEGGHSHNVTTGEGGHEHSFTGSAATSGEPSGTHAHSVTLSAGNTGNTGENAPFTVDTVPAYYSVIYIKKMKEYV
ncbi:phage tail fiber protein [Candidatus Termititenax aidoneus]|uniref:Phage tail fiber protein n=1 Tax=Termititenax aidoneus TaxID=2218524 RepID=A0A388TBK8_TERA1|nr:phage tail fiber protein [Candidatus Termititenax aidoneus]